MIDSDDQPASVRADNVSDHDQLTPVTTYVQSYTDTSNGTA